MLSATSQIKLEFLTKFLNMSKFQNRLILLYQRVLLQVVGNKREPIAFHLMVNYDRENVNHYQVTKQKIPRAY